VSADPSAEILNHKQRKADVMMPTPPRASSRGNLYVVRNVKVSGTWAHALDGYMTAMAAAGRERGTMRLHRHYLAQIANVHASPWRVTTTHLRELLAHPEWAPETRKSARSVFRGFYKWGHGVGLVDVNPAAPLDAVRVPRTCARPAPEQVVRDATASPGGRAALMAMLAAYAGLRCAEIAAVHSDHLVGDILRVRGKGGKVREVPFVVEQLFARLLEVDGWAFPGKTNGHLSPGHVSRVLSRALPRGWTAHTLRHRMATTAYAGTRDLLAVSAVLGHSRPETTQRYVRLPDDALRAACAAAA